MVRLLYEVQTYCTSAPSRGAVNDLAGFLEGQHSGGGAGPVKAGIGVGIFFLAGGIRRNPHPSIRAAIIAGLLTSTSIAAYTVWDKYVVSVIYVSPILLDLLANPLQALLLTPRVWDRRAGITTYWKQSRLELFGTQDRSSSSRTLKQTPSALFFIFSSLLKRDGFYSLELVHPFFWRPPVRHALVSLAIERMRLSLSFHPQNSVIAPPNFPPGSGLPGDASPSES